MYKKQCEKCSVIFYRKYNSTRFCSKRCANQVRGEELANANKSSGGWLVCILCGILKPLNSFSFNTRNDFSSGKKPHCKRCGANIREGRRRDRGWKHGAAKILLYNSRQRAKRAGMTHILSFGDIIIPDQCPVFGFDLKREERDGWYCAPSIDRVDNSRGYTKDNIVVVSRRANILKKDASIEELMSMAAFYKTLL